MGRKMEKTRKEPPEQVCLRLPAALKEELMREAYAQGLSFNKYVLTIICTRHQRQP